MLRDRGTGSVMRAVLAEVERWQAAGHEIALVRVVGRHGSAPCELGATMAVNEDGEIAGSISGGCVDAALVDEALAAISAADGTRRRRFGWDEDELGVGLSCGGEIDVLVESPLPRWYDEVQVALAAGAPAALVSVVNSIRAGLGKVAVGTTVVFGHDGSPSGSLGSSELDRRVGADVREALAVRRSTTSSYRIGAPPEPEEYAVLIDALPAPARFVIIGASDYAAALARVAKLLGYRVTACDPRPAFATAERLAEADEVVTKWPDAYLASLRPPLGPEDALCVMTHDRRVDVLALALALEGSTGYVGALGSRATTEQRLGRLVAAGVSPSALDRLRAPIGLDLGGQTPEETAISICAEVIALRHRRSGASLRGGTGPIHHRDPSGKPADGPVGAK